MEAAADAVPWFFVVSVMEKLRADAVMFLAELLTAEMTRSGLPAMLIVTEALLEAETLPAMRRARSMNW